MAKKLILLSKIASVIFTIIVIIGAENSRYLVIAQESKLGKSLNECQECCKVCLDKQLSDCPSAPVFWGKFDSMISHEDEMARLDNYFVELNNNPESTGYVIVYGGRINKYGELKERVKRIEAYIKAKNFDPSRLKIIQGGFRDKFEFELWRSPIENSYPPLLPTVDVEKVVFKGKMKPLSYCC